MKNQYLWLLGAGVAIGGFAYWKSRQSTDVPVIDTTAQLPATTTTTTTPVATQPTTVSLNVSLLLKQGSTGNEVKKLQGYLGVTADGIFGAQTAAALKAAKGVTQITLAQWGATTTINQNALKIGDKVMVNVGAGANVMKVQVLDDGTFYNTKQLYTNISYGTTIGKIITMTPDKQNYVVVYNSWFTAWIDTNVWVKASDVKKL